MGGLAGGLIAAVIWFRVKKVRLADYTDAFALGIAPDERAHRLLHGARSPRRQDRLSSRSSSGRTAPRSPGCTRPSYCSIGVLLDPAQRGCCATVSSAPALLYAPPAFSRLLRATDVSYPDARHLKLTFAQYTAIALVGYGGGGSCVALGRSPTPPGSDTTVRGRHAILAARRALVRVDEDSPIRLSRPSRGS
jgi:phosphatidylglycerol:prolipoprotein diacylglycerol transferase